MALSSKKGIFAATTSGTTQSVSGFGFAPKVILFWTANLSAAEGFTTHQGVMVGAACATGRSEVFSGWQSGSSAQTGAAYAPSNFGIVIGTGGVVTARATVTLTGDGFSLVWTSTPPAAALIHYMALGGSDLTNVKILTDTIVGDNTFGAYPITGVGFQADCALFLTSSGLTGDGTLDAYVGLGAAVSASKRWAVSVNSRGGDPADNWAVSLQRTDRCIVGVSRDGIPFHVDFTSFDADGLTLDVTADVPGITFSFVAVLLKTGGRADVGFFDKSTALGGVDTITPSIGGAQVSAVLEATYCKGAYDQLNADSRLSIGGFTAAAEGASWSGSYQQATPSVSASRITTAKALTIDQPDQTTLAECDGAITGTTATNTWTANSGSAEQILWVAFGGATATSITGTAAVASRKPFAAVLAHNYRFTGAVAGRKPTVTVNGAIPVSGIVGTAAIASRYYQTVIRATVEDVVDVDQVLSWEPDIVEAIGRLSPSSILAGATVQAGAQPEPPPIPVGVDWTSGEGTAGETMAGGPEISGTVALYGARPVISGQTASAFNEIHVAGRKPVIAATGGQLFTGTAAVAGHRPVIAAQSGSFVITGTAAVAGHRPVIAASTALRFIGTAALVANEPVVAATGVTGTMRASVAGHRPVLAASGTISLSVYTAVVAVAGHRPTLGTAGAAALNVPPYHLWPRAQLGVAQR